MLLLLRGTHIIWLIDYFTTITWTHPKFAILLKHFVIFSFLTLIMLCWLLMVILMRICGFAIIYAFTLEVELLQLLLHILSFFCRWGMLIIWSCMSTISPITCFTLWRSLFHEIAHKITCYKSKESENETAKSHQSKVNQS